MPDKYATADPNDYPAYERASREEHARLYPNVPWSRIGAAEFEKRYRANGATLLPGELPLYADRNRRISEAWGFPYQPEATRLRRTQTELAPGLTAEDVRNQALDQVMSQRAVEWSGMPESTRVPAGLRPEYYRGGISVSNLGAPTVDPKTAPPLQDQVSMDAYRAAGERMMREREARAQASDARKVEGARRWLRLKEMEEDAYARANLGDGITSTPQPQGLMMPYDVRR